MPNMLWVRRIACLLLVPISGCSNLQGQSTSAEPSLGIVSEVVAPGQLTRAISAYGLSQDQLVQLAAIGLQMTNTCLAKKGQPGDMSYESSPAIYVAESANDEARLSILWGVFGPVGNTAYRASASLGFATNPGSGDADSFIDCFEQTNSAFPGGQDWTSLMSLHSWPAGGPPLPSSDSRFLAAKNNWAGCMKSNGFDTQDPVELAITFRQAYPPSPAPSSTEIATYNADINCKIQTNLVGIGMAVQDAYDRQYLEQHQQELIEWRQSIETFIRTHA